MIPVDPTLFVNTRSYKRVVGFDSETYRIRPGLVTPPVVCGTFAERVDGEIVSSIHLGPEYLEKFRGLCRDPDVLLVAANTSFDTLVAIAAEPALVPIVFQKYADDGFRDVQLRQKLIDIAAGREEQNGQMFVERGGQWVYADYYLASLVQLYLGKDRWEQKKSPDAWRLRYAELDGVPLTDWPKEATDYAIEDAIDALLVFEAQGGITGDMPTEGIQNRAQFALELQTTWGIRTNPELVASLEQDLLTEQARVQRRLKKVGFLVKEPMTPAEARDNPEKVAGELEITKVKPLTKPQQKLLAKGVVPDGVEVIDDTYVQVTRKVVPYRWKRDGDRVKAYVTRVYAKRGLDAPTTAGREGADGVRVPEVATDKDTLYQSGSRILSLVADGGGVDKLIGTYLPVLKRGTEVPINARYEICVNTARTSAKSWTDDDGQRYGFNIQNLPAGRRSVGKRVREAFEAREGFCYSFSDYRTLELCALAEVCLTLFGFSRMAEAINEGRDLHLMMAAEMLGISYEVAVQRYEAGDKEVKQARNVSKVGNFGLGGGLGIESFVQYARAGYGLTLTSVQAKDVKTNWKRTWPEAGVYLDYIGSLVGISKITLVHPITGFIRGRVGYCDGANHNFQHLAAIGAKIALFDVARESYVDLGTPLYGSRPVAFIHDEIGIEVPKHKAHAAAMRQNFVMERAMALVIPNVKITAVPTLMARWFKEAEEVRCEAGHLVEWTPEIGKQKGFVPKCGCGIQKEAA